ncbi:hypothetical protein Tco_1330506, partial [Tanacetum coccineum]
AEVEEDDRERVRFCDGKISSRRKKSRESNSGDSGNTGDGGKTVGGAIGACGSGIDPLKGQKKCFPMRLGNSPLKPRYSQEYL